VSNKTAIPRFEASSHLNLQTTQSDGRNRNKKIRKSPASAAKAGAMDIIQKGRGGSSFVCYFDGVCLYYLSPAIGGRTAR
jgi:hypothetical protein